jgi:hypothetical protein
MDLMDAKLGRSTVAAGFDAESSGTSEDELEAKKNKTFVNPLNKTKTIDMEGEMSEGDWSSDNASNEGDLKVKNKEKKDK